MQELEIRTTGEVMLGGNVVGSITFAQPFVEAEVAGLWCEEGCARDEFGDPMSSSEELEDEISDLEDRVDDLEKVLKVAITALQVAKDMVEKALPKFDWGASILDAEAIALLNEGPLQINYALSKMPKVKK